MGAVHVNPSRPIADGIPFDDLDGFSTDQPNFLASRGVVFRTEFGANGKRFAGTIVSISMTGAEEIAFGRGLGEEVVGVLAETGTFE